MNKKYYGGKMNNKKGFTLIELLVVISIIGVLVGLVLASFSSAQKQARDTQRKSDLNQYRNALENYAHANNSLYPLLTYPNPVGNICSSSSNILYPNFISSCPDDPLSGWDYFYQSTSDRTSYILYADLETAGYWYICSDGKVGVSSSPPTITICTGSTD